jgi:hypothetical protein
MYLIQNLDKIHSFLLTNFYLYLARKEAKGEKWAVGVAAVGKIMSLRWFALMI